MHFIVLLFLMLAIPSVWALEAHATSSSYPAPSCMRDNLVKQNRSSPTRTFACIAAWVCDEFYGWRTNAAVYVAACLEASLWDNSYEKELEQQAETFISERSFEADDFWAHHGARPGAAAQCATLMGQALQEYDVSRFGTVSGQMQQRIQAVCKDSLNAEALAVLHREIPLTDY